MTDPPPAPARPRGRPRTRGTLSCDRCGRQTAKIRVTWPDGQICGTCFHTAARTHGACACCSRDRLLPGRDGDRLICRSCAGITTALDCDRCGTEGERYRRGLCARCAIRDDLTPLLLQQQSPPPELVRLVEILVSVDRPESIHTWKRNPPVRDLLRGLGTGTIPLSHNGLDTTPPGLAREHIRHLLIHHGLLPDRDPDLARFEPWLTQRLESLTDPAVRHPLEQFATWHHLHRLRTLSRRGEPLAGPVQAAKQEITEAGRFLTHLAEDGKMLTECTQADVDTWLADGPTTRHLIRTFVVHARKNKLSPALEIGFRKARTSRLLSNDQRLAWISACLTGTPDTVPYRVAASLLLLYAQPLVRIAGLRTDQVQAIPSGLRLLLGQEPVAVPEPFAQLLREHLAARPNLRTANTGGSPWLFPSTRAGQHLTPGTIMNRLRGLGIDLLGARNSSIRDLVRHVPAPIVATQLGYSQPVTHQHAALAAQPMARYAGLRARQRT